MQKLSTKLLSTVFALMFLVSCDNSFIGQHSGATKNDGIPMPKNSEPSERPAGSIVAWGSEGVNIDDVPEGNDFVQLAIASDGGVNYALRSNGTIAAWGDPTHSNEIDLPEGGGFTAIATDGNHLIALRNDGTIYPDHSLSEGDNFVAVAAKKGIRFALRDNGTIAAWGSLNAAYTAPVADDFVALAAGGAFGVALSEDGTITTWGDDEYGQISGAPTENGYKVIAAGNYHSLAINDNGFIEQWGMTSVGKPDGPGFTEIAASWHSLALHENGSLYAWGDDFAGQVSDTPTRGSFIEPAVGLANSYAIRIGN